jgi:hypothetical protein
MSDSIARRLLDAIEAVDDLRNYGIEYDEDKSVYCKMDKELIRLLRGFSKHKFKDESIQAIFNTLYYELCAYRFGEIEYDNKCYALLDGERFEWSGYRCDYCMFAIDRNMNQFVSLWRYDYSVAHSKAKVILVLPNADEKKGRIGNRLKVQVADDHEYWQEWRTK